MSDGLYIHIPWCRRLCPYCDFAVQVRRNPPHAEYLRALENELRDRTEDRPGHFSTIYFGGGTPSLWDPNCLASLLATIRGEHIVVDDAEITLECNPVDCDTGRLRAWLAAGVNRLSIGIQALDSSILTFLGRGPAHGDGLAALQRAREAGMTNVSADVMIGVQADAQLSLEDTLQAIVPWVTHISVYELTVEPDTRFGSLMRRGKLPVASEERRLEEYVRVHEILTELGFEHYEISSYARPGARSRHNQGYWQGRPFLGIGVGASSFWDGCRVDNLRDTVAYLRQNGLGVAASVHRMTTEDSLRDLAWLSMRTGDGAPRELVERFAGLGEWLTQSGLAVLDEVRCRPTLRGFLFADQIAARIVASKCDLPPGITE